MDQLETGLAWPKAGPQGSAGDQGLKGASQVFILQPWFLPHPVTLLLHLRVLSDLAI